MISPRTTHTQPHLYSFEMPFTCSDGTNTMEQTDIKERDASLQSVLDNLLIFYRVMAIAQPNRAFLPYESETYQTLPIIRRRKHSKRDGDPTFQINERHFLNGRRNGIIARMFDPKHQNFHIYGGAHRAGPRVDANFTGEFPFRYNVVAVLQFAVAIEIIMGRPTEDETIDKISNSKGYILPNIRWADKRLQARNRGTYKWRLAEEPIQRPPLPRICHPSWLNAKKPRDNKSHRGTWNNRAKPKPPMVKMRQLIASVFSKQSRFSKIKGRQKRRSRNSAQAKATVMRLLTPQQQRHAQDTFSRYTTTSTIIHTVTPAKFKSTSKLTKR